MFSLVGDPQLKGMRKMTLDSSSPMKTPRVFFDCLYVIQIGDHFWNGSSLVLFSDAPDFFMTYALAVAEMRRIPKDFKRSFGSQVRRIDFPEVLDLADAKLCQL